MAGMQASVEMDEGLKRFKEIIEEFPEDSSHWNEAQNRFQFIDRLMIECLGWLRPDMNVEDSDQSGGKADYVLGNPPKAVLEAKRESKPWNSLPTGKTSQVRKIKPLIICNYTRPISS
ncbi:hypothetical protein AAII07_22885 [Microvirga sp. 0TCS3.31]